MALLPENIGRGFLFVVSLAAFAYTDFRLGGKPLALGEFLASPPVLHCLLNSNLDWMPLLGFVLPPPVGLFFLAVKPQVGSGGSPVLAGGGLAPGQMEGNDPRIWAGDSRLHPFAADLRLVASQYDQADGTYLAVECQPVALIHSGGIYLYCSRVVAAENQLRHGRIPLLIPACPAAFLVGRVGVFRGFHEGNHRGRHRFMDSGDHPIHLWRGRVAAGGAPYDALGLAIDLKEAIIVATITDRCDHPWHDLERYEVKGFIGPSRRPVFGPG
jgi:hypothetical protein